MKPQISSRIHIAIVCPALGSTSSVANVALKQAYELARQFHVTLVSDSFPTAVTDGPQRNYSCIPSRAPSFGILRRFAHVPNEVAFTLAVRYALVRLHIGQPVDVVICHTHSAATIAARFLKSKFGVPFALVTHGEITDVPKGAYDPRQTWFYKRVATPAYETADLVVALSPYMGSLAIRCGADPLRVSLIPNGIDPAEFGQVSYEASSPKGEPKKLELLYVGRLCIEKGVDVLIEAVALLRNRGVQLRLRIIGSGVEAEHLQLMTKELKIADAVDFMGSVPRNKLGGVYRTADVVCVPSRGDPLPTVVLEAMASGVAVVGADTGGIPFMIANEVTGLVCPVADPVALADALERFVMDAELGTRMGRAGQQRAVQEFNWRKVGMLLAAGLMNVIEGKSRKEK